MKHNSVIVSADQRKRLFSFHKDTGVLTADISDFKIFGEFVPKSVHIAKRTSGNAEFEWYQTVTDRKRDVLYWDYRCAAEKLTLRLYNDFLITTKD